LPIRSVIDIGANDGGFAKHVRRIFPNAHILCFEPLPEVFKRLQAWSDSQGTNNVTALNVALGDTEGHTQMQRHSNHSASSSFLRTTEVAHEIYPITASQELVSVAITTLDNAISELSLSLAPEIFVKIDVQGYEDRVIRGGPRTFGKARACMLEVNVDSLYEGQATFLQLVTDLDLLGFRYAGNVEQIYGRDGHAIFVDAMFVKQ
jgi:FkbM family methyltransferase